MNDYLPETTVLVAALDDDTDLLLRLVTALTDDQLVQLQDAAAVIEAAVIGEQDDRDGPVR